MPGKPVNGGGPQGAAAHEERSRQALIHEVQDINPKGHDVLEAEGQVVTVAAAIKEHDETSPDLIRVHSKQVTKYTIYAIGLACVYILDVLLFGATAEYIIGLLTGSWVLVALGKYLIPLAFLGIEVLCALKMNDARDEHEHAREEEVPTYGW